MGENGFFFIYFFSQNLVTKVTSNTVPLLEISSVSVGLSRESSQNSRNYFLAFPFILVFSCVSIVQKSHPQITNCGWSGGPLSEILRATIGLSPEMFPNSWTFILVLPLPFILVFSCFSVVLLNFVLCFFLEILKYIFRPKMNGYQ